MMALITGLVRQHLGTSTDNFSSLVSELDLAVLNAGSLAYTIWEQIVPEGKKFDVDQVAATASALIAYLGHVGELIDAMEDFKAVHVPRARNA